MSSTTSPDIGSYLQSKLRFATIALPLFLSIAASVVIGLVVVANASRQDQELLSAVAPHVALLIETNDRPELQRLIVSMSSRLMRPIEVVTERRIFASSVSPQRIGMTPSAIRGVVLDFQWSGSSLVSTESVGRSGGANSDSIIQIFRPVRSLLIFLAIIASSVFVLSLLVLSYLTRQLAALTKSTIEEPVRKLNDAIHHLHNGVNSTLESTGIKELEQIREAIQETQQKLTTATENLAASKAKELTADAYRQLIHDLHTPVTALRQWSKLPSRPNLTPDERIEIADKISELAEHILSQVGAAKGHLDLTIKMRDGVDLNETIKRSIERVSMSNSGQNSSRITSHLHQDAIIVSHDPTLIERVVSNLIANSIEASSRQIEVGTRIVGGIPQIVVSDDGPGMTPEAVSLHLLGRGKSSKGDRSGIGLSSCNHIVRSHGGKVVHRKSKLGGSEFEIRLRPIESENAV